MNHSFDHHHGQDRGTARGSDPLAEILGPGGLLSQRLPHYEARGAQLTMARRVMASLEEEHKLVVEAGTGTGKTLAYLTPVVLSGKKVIISTGTKTLQEQLVHKDIPLLLEMLETEIPFACMKGISNYICHRRLSEVRRCPELLPDPNLAELLRWVEETETGDRAEMPRLSDASPLWSTVSPTPETRLGPPCDHYEDCFVTRMRRTAASARIVVINHHLLLADLALRSIHPSAGVLPTFEALIVDEAHSLEAIATSFFGRGISTAKLATLAKEVRRAALLDQDPASEKLAQQVTEGGAELFHLLQQELASRARSPQADRFTTGRLRLDENPFSGSLEQPYFRLDSALEALGQHLELRAGGREELVNLAQRVENTRETLALFADRPAQGHIFWAEHNRSSLALHASPVEVAPLLKQTLLEESWPITFTSATLAAPDSKAQKQGTSALSYLQRRVGLDRCDEEVEELVLPSPFNFERQVLLYLPRDLPLPQSADFILRAAERISQLIDITGGRALVLFTSYRNLQSARTLLRAALQYPILCQGEQPRSLLLEQFRENVTSVLLATASFWEGVDVVGESLSLVVIDRLPFAVPTDPLIAARMELIEQRGENAFTQYQLPQAALSLKQGFGRLIRHRGDRGIVTVLDRRLWERSYGKDLLSALPACPRTSDLLRVRAFSKEVLRLSRAAPAPTV